MVNQMCKDHLAHHRADDKLIFSHKKTLKENIQGPQKKS